MIDQPNKSPLSTATLGDRIAEKINPDMTLSLPTGEHGQLAFANLAQIMEVAKVVAISREAIPGHLRDNVGACLAVCIQASEWQMSPFAVANKTYVVKDRMAFEAQLINAVILRRAPLASRFKIEYRGEGTARRCKVSVKVKDGDAIEVVEYESPEIGKIPVQNSPLWKGDPDQQLFYYSSRAMCRRHFPDVLLGIYTPEEIESDSRDVTPVPGKPSIGPEAPTLPESAKQPDPAAAQIQEPKGKSAPTGAKQPRPEKPTKPMPQTEAPAQESKPEPEPGNAGGEAQPAAKTFTEEDRLKLVEEVNEMRDKAGITMAEFKKRIAGLQWAAASDMVTKYPAETLLEIKTRWQEVLDYGKEPKAE